MTVTLLYTLRAKCGYMKMCDTRVVGLCVKMKEKMHYSLYNSLNHFWEVDGTGRKCVMSQIYYYEKTGSSM